jgi:hypothetical protein
MHGYMITKRYLLTQRKEKLPETKSSRWSPFTD